MTESRQYETLKFVFLKAVSSIYPEFKVEIQNSLNNGAYGEIFEKDQRIILTSRDYEAIKEKMKKLIDNNCRIKLLNTDIEELKMKSKYMVERDDIKEFLENCGDAKLREYELVGYKDYFYEVPAESTNVIKCFDLYKYNCGFILKPPRDVFCGKIGPFKNTPKIARAFSEGNDWEKIMGINFTSSINKKVLNDEIAELIMLNETLHTKKITEIANDILKKEEVRLVTIAGPSSSGKTTLSKKLMLHLKTSGAKTLAISLDDYYVGRANVPLDANGEKDFETIEALDVKLLNKNLKDLIEGRETELPLYDFQSGERKKETHRVALEENGIIIIEGIHGLNLELTNEIPAKNKYKIYISCLTQTNLDRHNRVHTTDVRRLRRIVRDSLSRETTGEETLKMWGSVRKGEEKWIFTYQEEADAIFNSSLSYEIGVLKSYALKELIKIKIDSPCYEEARRLSNLLSCFIDIESSLVPSDSILKEFIGGSIFYNY